MTPDVQLRLLIVITDYFLGSIPFGLLIVKISGGGDIRKSGSGNIGAANVARNAGAIAGVLTLLLDAAKGYLAVFLAARWTNENIRWMTAAAVLAVIGHMFPIWLRFRGGKGVATGFGVFLVAAPLAALSSIGLFAIVLLLTRYVSLASILGAASFPVFAWFMVRGEKPAPYIAAQIIVSLLIILKHHQNIRRLATGTENRFGARSHERKPA